MIICRSGRMEAAKQDNLHANLVRRLAVWEAAATLHKSVRIYAIFCTISGSAPFLITIQPPQPLFFCWCMRPLLYLCAADRCGVGCRTIGQGSAGYAFKTALTITGSLFWENKCATGSSCCPPLSVPILPRALRHPHNSEGCIYGLSSTVQVNA